MVDIEGGGDDVDALAASGVSLLSRAAGGAGAGGGGGNPLYQSDVEEA